MLEHYWNIAKLISRIRLFWVSSTRYYYIAVLNVFATPTGNWFLLETNSLFRHYIIICICLNGLYSMCWKARSTLATLLPLHIYLSSILLPSLNLKLSKALIDEFNLKSGITLQFMRTIENEFMEANHIPSDCCINIHSMNSIQLINEISNFLFTLRTWTVEKLP